MNPTHDAAYWTRLTRQLREALCQSQEQFAAAIDTNQATVSRWERGASVPGYEMRQRLEEMAREVGLATLDEISAVVRVSPFPMFLIDRWGFVVAASSTCGFAEGRLLLEQALPPDRDDLQAFQTQLADAGFWERTVARFEYRDGRGSLGAAIVMPVTIRGTIYGLVQKLHSFTVCPDCAAL